jgi:hypothetical protein
MREGVGNDIRMVFAILPSGERYGVVYLGGQEGPALRAIGRWAEDTRLAFNWANAAKLSQKIRVGK